MNENTIAFVRKHRSLFWYTPEEKLNQITPAFLTETILNYGSLDDVRELFHVVGIKKVATIFFNAIKKSKRNNYFPDVENFFTLYFNKYVYGNT